MVILCFRTDSSTTTMLPVGGSVVPEAPAVTLIVML
jgi:hypothetical protein